MTINEKYLNEMEINMYKKSVPLKKYSSVAQRNACALLNANANWHELVQEIQSCAACSLSKTRNKSVPGNGDYNANWLFVGEGPGIMEDKSGNPFVGRSGRLLDNMMKAMHLNRSRNVYIANVMKCRAQSAGVDRPPTEEEIQICLPYLKKQINWLQPKIIVALGKTAACALLGLHQDEALTNMRGKSYFYESDNAKIPVVVTYHPSYLLRTPSDKAKVWEDLCLALSMMPESNESFGLLTPTE